MATSKKISALPALPAVLGHLLIPVVDGNLADNVADEKMTVTQLMAWITTQLPSPPDLTPYAKLDGSNQPFTGNLTLNDDLILDGQIYQNTGHLAISPSSNRLWTSDGHLSVDWLNRQLVASNGSTVALDWATPGHINFGTDTLTLNGVGITDWPSFSTPTLASVLAAGNTSGANDATFEQNLIVQGRSLLGGATDDTSTPLQIGQNGGVSLRTEGNIVVGDSSGGKITLGPFSFDGRAGQGIFSDTGYLALANGNINIHQDGSGFLHLQSLGQCFSDNPFVITGSTSVPTLSINLASGQSANALNITSFGGSAGDIFSIGPTGDLAAAGSGTFGTLIAGSNPGIPTVCFIGNTAIDNTVLENNGILINSGGSIHVNAPTGQSGSLSINLSSSLSWTDSGVTVNGNLLMSGPQSLIFPLQTSSAPSWVEGGLYYDLTLHKLMVGGQSGWETVTSL